MYTFYTFVCGQAAAMPSITVCQNHIPDVLGRRVADMPTTLGVTTPIQYACYMTNAQRRKRTIHKCKQASAIYTIHTIETTAKLLG